MIGMFASSKSGHDKDTIYIIIKEEKEYVYVVDGRIRTLNHPKKKNKKHIQIIKKFQNLELAEQLRAGDRVMDEQIKRAIKLMRMDNSEI